MIATGGYSEENLKEFIKIWDANTGKPITKLKGHTAAVYCLGWTANRDGGTLISSSCDHSIRTWNTTTWQQIAVLTRHTDCVHGISISPNGRILASASLDNTAQLWNLETGQPIGSPLQPEHADFVNCVSFSTDGKLLATGSNRNAYTWDVSLIVREAGLDNLLNVSRPFLIFVYQLNLLSY
jgi:WD40 repeat protein